MGFDRATVDISCDECGLETEPEELMWSPDKGGGYSVEAARESLRRDGWVVDSDDRVLCSNCAFGGQSDDE